MQRLPLINKFLFEFSFFFFFFPGSAGDWTQALYILGKYPSTELQPQSWVIFFLPLWKVNIYVLESWPVIWKIQYFELYLLGVVLNLFWFLYVQYYCLDCDLQKAECEQNYKLGIWMDYHVAKKVCNWSVMGPNDQSFSRSVLLKYILWTSVSIERWDWLMEKALIKSSVSSNSLIFISCSYSESGTWEQSSILLSFSGNFPLGILFWKNESRCFGP